MCRQCARVCLCQRLTPLPSPRKFEGENWEDTDTVGNEGFRADSIARRGGGGVGTGVGTAEIRII